MDEQKKGEVSFIILALIFLTVLGLSRVGLSQIPLPLTWETGTSHAKQAGADRALIFIAHAEEDGAISLESVTYGGQPMDPVIDEIVGTTWRAYVAAYILDEDGIAAATDDTFELTWSTTPDFVAYSSVFLQNVDQTALTGASDRNSTASSTPNPIATSALATNNGDMVIVGATAGESGSYTLQYSFTEGNDQSFGSTATGVTGHKSATGAAETPSAGHSGPNRQVIIGFVVQAIPPDPNKTTHPDPGNGEDDVLTSTDLSWDAPLGYSPTSYDVCFGTDTIAHYNPKDTVYTNSYEPPDDLEYGTTYYWAVDSNDDGTIYPGDDWSFTTLVPGPATNPNPSNGAYNISISTDLSWDTPYGYTPTGYEVYFGTNPIAHNNPKHTVYIISYDPPGDLELGTMYYWAVDSNDDGTIYPGDDWSFTTLFPFQPPDRVVGNMMLINDNGGWCWYQDEKIIYDPVGGNVITSTAAQGSGFGGVGGTRTNDMDTTTFNIATGKRTRVVAREGGGGDDHNMGAFWIRPDGRYLHIYCMHYNDQDSFYRLATNPYDGDSWGDEEVYNWETISGLTDSMTSSYTNVHYLSGEGTGSGRLYNIIRVFERTPCVSYSDDWGETWQYMGRLNGIVGTTTYSNFYHKFRSNGVDRIHFIGCEQHPRNYTNSVFHGYIQNGKSYNSLGVEIDTIDDQDAPTIQEYTPVWLTGPVAEGEYHTGWTNELELDKNGFPVCLFQTRYGTEPYGGDPGAADHRFFYGRFDGLEWISTELAKMGTGLHDPEEDYIGMGCIHPDDANLIYISTPFDPRNDFPLEHHEIFKGVTSDNGLTWDWTQITFDSTEDNIRPAIPPWDANNTAVFWTRGIYPGREQYDFVVVGIIEEENETLGLVTYIDADEINTKESDDSPFTPTGPDGNPGAADNQWHEYTGYGNAGSTYTAGDSGTEDAPAIKTTISGLADGTYDVFAYFWCDPDLDWGVRGGLTSSDLLCFSKQSSQHAEASQFFGSVNVFDTDVQLYRVYIGRNQVSGGTSIDVYIDNYDSSFSGNVPTRTTYDGVGVAPVIPDYAGDLYRDGKVNFKDIAILGQGWQTIYYIDTLAQIADNWLAGI